MLDISAEDAEFIRKVLKELAPDCDVFAFGSRATGKNLKKYSDLDLILSSPKYPRDLSSLKEAFTESNLPFRVDVMLWNDLSEDFRKLIEADLQKIQDGEV